ncbi:cation transporting ATPase C-terminal domain-containing protein [Micromonospora olivasterospora]|uniref:cation-translocating P-type ATPase C-terminal domain-containing protein n=1 Tax=Micromonospora olivasterospora TaxID=1880 RepID=UPI0024826E73|nr:cation-translocating P-type ATPase C-terminal domain-containing protein [Micromonospora olivasterospora]
MVACQIGTALAARTERAPLRSIGLATNRLLLRGIAFELAFAATIVTVPPLQTIFGTTPPDPLMLAILITFPILLWASGDGQPGNIASTSSALLGCVVEWAVAGVASAGHDDEQLL